MIMTTTAPYFWIYIYIYHFCILFGNVDWLKTGHMTFYKKWYSTDVTNYSNTHAIYKFIFRNIDLSMYFFRNIRAIHDLSMYFQKHPCYTRFNNVFSKISTNFKNFKNSKQPYYSLPFRSIHGFIDQKIYIDPDFVLGQYIFIGP